MQRRQAGATSRRVARVTFPKSRPSACTLASSSRESSTRRRTYGGFGRRRELRSLYESCEKCDTHCLSTTSSIRCVDWRCFGGSKNATLRDGNYGRTSARRGGPWLRGRAAPERRGRRLREECRRLLASTRRAPARAARTRQPAAPGASTSARCEPRTQPSQNARAQGSSLRSVFEGIWGPWREPAPPSPAPSAAPPCRSPRCRVGPLQADEVRLPGAGEDAVQEDVAVPLPVAGVVGSRPEIREEAGAAMPRQDVVPVLATE